MAPTVVMSFELTAKGMAGKYQSADVGEDEKDDKDVPVDTVED